MESFRFIASEVFAIYGRGIVFRGVALTGSVAVGARVKVCTRSGPLQAIVAAVEIDRMLVPQSAAGVEMGILLADFDCESVNVRFRAMVNESNSQAVLPVESVLNINLPATLEGVGG